MEKTIEQAVTDYCNSTCGIGKYYSSRLVLLNRLKRTGRLRWAGIPVPEFIQVLTKALINDGIPPGEEPNYWDVSAKAKLERDYIAKEGK